MGQLHHGLPGRVLVIKGEEWRCIKCGCVLIVVTDDRKLIECHNSTCEQYQWHLLRPDMASCEILGMGSEGKVPPVDLSKVYDAMESSQRESTLSGPTSLRLGKGSKKAPSPAESAAASGSPKPAPDSGPLTR
jgi:hypothetical protein